MRFDTGMDRAWPPRAGAALLALALLAVAAPLAAQVATPVPTPAATRPAPTRPAPTRPAPTRPAPVSDGVEGIIVNATITAAGQAFFREFTEIWRDKPDSDNYDLDIGERPSRRFGNQIWVTYGQKRIFQGYLPVKLDRVRALAEQAVETAYANLITLGLMGAPSDDADVAADEM